MRLTDVSIYNTPLLRHAGIFITLLALLAVLTGCTGKDSSAQALQGSSPIQYQVTAVWDDATHSLKATTVLHFRNEFNQALKELVFHWYADSYRIPDTQPVHERKLNQRLASEGLLGTTLSDLSASGGGVTTTAVTLENGQPLEYEHVNQSLTVQLKQPLAPNGSVSLRIRYEIQFPYGAWRLAYNEQFAGGTYWTPQLAVYNPLRHAWNRVPNYPGYPSDYFYAADYDVHLQLPASWLVVTTGQQLDHRVQDGVQSTHIRANGIRQLAFYASPDYTETKRPLPDGKSLAVYTLDDGEQPSDQWLDAAADAIAFFSDAIGELPGKHWTFAEAPYAGMNDSLDGIILFGREEKLNGPLSPDMLRLIAKQWFGSAIGINSRTDGFLDEGMSEFAGRFYRHQRLQEPWPSASTTDYRGLALPAAQLGEDAATIYRERGAELLAAWTQVVGSDAVPVVWKSYYNRYRGQFATIDSFLNVAEDALGQEAHDRLRQLLNNPPSS